MLLPESEAHLVVLVVVRLTVPPVEPEHHDGHLGLDRHDDHDHDRDHDHDHDHDDYGGHLDLDLSIIKMIMIMTLPPPNIFMIKRTTRTMGR